MRLSHLVNVRALCASLLAAYLLCALGLRAAQATGFAPEGSLVELVVARVESDVRGNR